MRLAGALLLLAANCAPTPLQQAAISANAAKGEAERAETVAAAICTAGYKAAARLERGRRAAEIERLDPYCLAVGAALTRYESARNALLAAIVAADLHVPGASALLDDRRDRLTTAGLVLAAAIQGRP